MKIAIDLDGVQYEWDKTARYMLREIRGCSGLGGPSFSWDMIMETVDPEDWQWLWTEGVKLGLFRHGHLVQGAIQGIRALRDAGHELILVTHRPKEAIRDTNAWLELHFGSEEPYPWSGQHILSNMESKTIVNADILIDDKPQNIEEWNSAGRVGILFARPWNCEEAELFSRTHIIVANGWPAVVREINDPWVANEMEIERDPAFPAWLK